MTTLVLEHVWVSPCFCLSSLPRSSSVCRKCIKLRPTPCVSPFPFIPTLLCPPFAPSPFTISPTEPGARRRMLSSGSRPARSRTLSPSSYQGSERMCSPTRLTFKPTLAEAGRQQVTQSVNPPINAEAVTETVARESPPVSIRRSPATNPWTPAMDWMPPINLNSLGGAISLTQGKGCLEGIIGYQLRLSCSASMRTLQPDAPLLKVSRF